jgi:hypothetical protein
MAISAGNPRMCRHSARYFLRASLPWKTFQDSILGKQKVSQFDFRFMKLRF